MNSWSFLTSIDGEVSQESHSSFGSILFNLDPRSSKTPIITLMHFELLPRLFSTTQFLILNHC